MQRKRKSITGSAIHTKKAKIAQKELQKTIAKQMAEKEPCIKIPDSEIKLENIIPGSPVFVPYKCTTPKGKGKGIKDFKINMSSKNSDSDMARRKCTKTKEELEKEAKDKAKAKCRALHAKQGASAAKAAHRSSKVHKTQADGKAPHKQLATKAACKGGGGALAPASKPQRNYAIIAMRETRRFQKSMDLLIPLLPFQHLIREISQDFRIGLCFQSSQRFLFS